MSLSKDNNVLLLTKKNFSKKIFFNKTKHITFVILTILFLLIFPLLIYEITYRTLGVIELSNLEKSALNPHSTKQILVAINNYLEEFPANKKILQIQLKALQQIEKPSLEMQVKKIRIIKMLLKETWFPSYTLYQQLGEILYNMEYYQESQYYLTKYVLINKDLSLSNKLKLHFLVYNIYMFDLNYQKAIESAQAVLEIQPNDPNWTLKLAKSYLANGNYISAKIELEKLIYLAEGNPIQLEVFFKLIDILTELNLNDKIEFYYHYIVSIHKNKKSEILSAYAKYLINQQNHEKALEKWKIPYTMYNSKITNMKKEFDNYLKS